MFVFFLLHSKVINTDIIWKSGVGKGNLCFLYSSMCVYVFQSCVSISARTGAVFSSMRGLINGEYKRSSPCGFYSTMTKPTMNEPNRDPEFFTQVPRIGNSFAFMVLNRQNDCWRTAEENVQILQCNTIICSLWKYFRHPAKAKNNSIEIALLWFRIQILWSATDYIRFQIRIALIPLIKSMKKSHSQDTMVYVTSWFSQPLVVPGLHW